MELNPTLTTGLILFFLGVLLAGIALTGAFVPEEPVIPPPPDNPPRQVLEANPFIPEPFARQALGANLRADIFLPGIWDRPRLGDERVQFRNQIVQFRNQMLDMDRHEGLLPMPMFQQVSEHQAPEARERSRELLIENLSPMQREEFLATGEFVVFCGQKKERMYEIKTGVSNNVSLNGRTFCAYPPGVPVYDVMLAQKIALETDEAGFLLTANTHPPLAVPQQFFYRRDIR